MTSNGNNPTEQLFEAIRANNLDGVDEHLDAGADVEAIRGNYTPLTLAAWLGHVHVAERLLDRGAQLDPISAMYDNALHMASMKGHIEMGELLLSRGAGMEQRTRASGDTALQLALRDGRHDMATWLLDRGARANAVDFNGRTALYLAAVSGYPDLGRLLEQPGVKQQVDAKCCILRRTALYVAALHGRVGHVRQLVVAGASHSVMDTWGRTPLHLACGQAQVEVMRVLLQHGAEVNALGKHCISPLMRVIHTHDAHPACRVKAVKLLLEHGADRSIRNQHGATARDLIAGNHMPTVVELLDTYFPLKQQMKQVLLGLRGPTESPLTRFAQHSAFEPKVLSIVAAFHSGKSSPAFEQLQREALEQRRSTGGERVASSSSSSSASSPPSRPSPFPCPSPRPRPPRSRASSNPTANPSITTLT